MPVEPSERRNQKVVVRARLEMNVGGELAGYDPEILRTVFEIDMKKALGGEEGFEIRVESVSFEEVD